MWKSIPLLVAGFFCGCDRTIPWTPEAAPSDTAAVKPAPTDEELVADAILRFVVTAKELGSTREFYGTAGQKEIILVSAAWPKCDYPSLAGYAVRRMLSEEQRELSRIRTIGVRLDKFDLNYETSGEFFPPDAGIEVVVFNAGGDKNGMVVGGCRVYLSPRKVQDGWTVNCVWAED